MLVELSTPIHSARRDARNTYRFHLSLRSRCTAMLAGLRTLRAIVPEQRGVGTRIEVHVLFEDRNERIRCQRGIARGLT